MKSLDAGDVVGRVLLVHRYPVKSLLGEALASSTVDARGLVGDRLWAVRDQAGKFGSAKTTRRFRAMDGLFRFHARLDGSVPVITMPDQREWRGDDPAIGAELSRWIGVPVSLAAEEGVSHFDEGAVSLLSTAAIASVSRHLGNPVDPRRFRANLLVEVAGAGFPEDSWCGRTVAVGAEVRLQVSHPLERCLMVNLPQDGLPMDARVLRAVARHHANTLAVVASVAVGGTVAVGDAVRVL